MEKVDCYRCGGTGKVRVCRTPVYVHCKKIVGFKYGGIECIKCAKKLPEDKIYNVFCNFCSGTGRVDWVDDLFRGS